MFGFTKKAPSDLAATQKRLNETREAWNQFLTTLENLQGEMDCTISIRGGAGWSDAVRVVKLSNLKLEIEVKV